jgi:hypothetical protein
MDPKNARLEAGDTDSFGNKVSRVLASDAHKKYVIWETTDGQILVDSDDQKIENTPALTSLTLAIGSLVTGRKDLEGKYNSNIGYAYKLCLEGNEHGAIKTLNETLAEIRKVLKRQRSSKLAYLSGALIFAALCEALWVLFKFLEPRHPSLGSYDTAAAGVAVSILGGVLSVALSLGNRNLDLDDPFAMTMIYGALRMVIALLAGFAATLMVRTGVVLSFLKNQDAFGGYLLACFLGGFSERWVSKSLGSLEKLPASQSSS